MLNVLNMKNRGKGNTYFKNVISKEGACLYFESLIDRKLSGRTHLPFPSSMQMQVGVGLFSLKTDKK